jgi:hypothetical protein
MKNLRVLGGAVAAVVSVAMASQAHAATSGNSTITLTMAEFAQIQVNTASLTLTPTQGDFEAGYVEATGASGISVDVRTNSEDGCRLKFSGQTGDGRGSKITSGVGGDFFVKSSTTGTSMPSYMAVKTTEQNIWAGFTAKPQFTDTPGTIQVDVKVTNLEDYIAGSYNNVLTFTVAPN